MWIQYTCGNLELATKNPKFGNTGTIHVVRTGEEEVQCEEEGSTKQNSTMWGGERGQPISYMYYFHALFLDLKQTNYKRFSIGEFFP